jgi:hypothetical protein
MQVGRTLHQKCLRTMVSSISSNSSSTGLMLVDRT